MLHQVRCLLDKDSVAHKALVKSKEMINTVFGDMEKYSSLLFAIRGSKPPIVCRDTLQWRYDQASYNAVKHEFDDADELTIVYFIHNARVVLLKEEEYTVDWEHEPQYTVPNDGIRLCQGLGGFYIELIGSHDDAFQLDAKNLYINHVYCNVVKECGDGHYIYIGFDVTPLSQEAEFYNAEFSNEERPDLLEHYTVLTNIVSELYKHHMDAIHWQCRQGIHYSTRGRMYDLLKQVLPDILAKIDVDIESAPYRFTLDEIENACIATYPIRERLDDYPYVDADKEYVYLISMLGYEIHQGEDDDGYITYQPGGELAPFTVSTYNLGNLPIKDGYLTVMLNKHQIRFTCIVVGDKEENND